ncbi:hypothetical protein A3A21_04045 [Candidatus Jorgensenbacteria bacterium RIFCSPLOWO2_01_FULL_45_25b]|uniref:Transcriptional regulator n=1 Tax=Candidatus Jorgensenbacteria bacterium RIFCSPLOWO2_01_FULL_45_25b TaxID=1798471 RepID=A0A1F6BWU7_9BACT|nr:MAG: hypothetical protein A3A21_04045 [Candidatus Jorgensenbacteria bacterium RIFCSPLOWO2_01_FULL_45_25b]
MTLTKEEKRCAEELLELIQKTAKNKELLDKFLWDLLAPREYREIIKRWQIVKMLNKGVSQREIMRELKVAAVTITRGSRMLLNENGGFNAVIQRFGYGKKKEKKGEK